MKHQDQTAFASLMQGVYALYRADLSDAVLAIWWEAMRPFEFVVVRDALNRHAVNPDTGQFLPKPADVVKLANGSTKDKALMAWTRVVRAISQVGAYQSVSFDDGAINAVLEDMGGWPELCHKPEGEFGFAQNEFVMRYRAYSARGDAPTVRHLPGLVELQNGARGFTAPEPVRIGTPQRALPERV